MMILNELNRRFRQIILPVLAILLMGYFVYHAIQGDRGFISYLRLEKAVNEAQKTLHLVRSERQKMEHNVRLLSPESLDLDMLEERARGTLGRIGENEFVIYAAP